jgi:NAD-dependent histone deacetylase SIR2
VRVPGKEIEEAVMARRVPLCKVCNVTTKSKPEQKRKRSKKRQMGKWDSDDEDLSEDGGIELKGVMKVRNPWLSPPKRGF